MILLVNGYGRSGSTLLELLLARQAGVVCLGELRNIWERASVGYKCSCDRPITTCPFWTDVLEQTFGGVLAEHIEEMVSLRKKYDRIRNFDAIKDEHRNPGIGKYVDIYKRIYGAVQDSTQCEVIIDTSKNPSHAEILNRYSDLPITNIHLVRHPCAVVYSWSRKKVRKESPTLEYLPRHRSLKSAVLWRTLNQQAAMVCSRNHLLRYEELAESPDSTIRETLGLLGRDVKERTDFDAMQIHTVGGNPVKFESEPLRIRQDDEWKRKQKRFDSALTWLITGKIAKKYGYNQDG